MPKGKNKNRCRSSYSKETETARLTLLAAPWMSDGEQTSRLKINNQSFRNDFMRVAVDLKVIVPLTKAVSVL